MAGESAHAPPTRAHGGESFALLRARGLEPGTLLDFSVNINPYGPCPAVAQAAGQAAIERYPDPQGDLLKHALAASLDVPPSHLVIGNGAADLLWTLARTLLAPGAPVLVVEPTFCEFRAACLATRARVVEWRAQAAAGFAVDLAAVDRLLTASGAKVLYLCNPNSPTGWFVPLAEVAALAEAHPRVAVVLDEAFLSLSRHHGEARRPLPPNVIRVRSFTKEHTIAGLRIGYLVAPPAVATGVEANRPAWTVNAVAEAAALAALSEEAFVAASRERIFADQARMVEALRELGLDPLPSSTLFFLVPVPDTARLKDRLLAHGILIRDCASYGLDGFIRLASRPSSEVRRLCQALRLEIPR